MTLIDFEFLEMYTKKVYIFISVCPVVVMNDWFCMNAAAPRLLHTQWSWSMSGLDLKFDDEVSRLLFYEVFV